MAKRDGSVYRLLVEEWNKTVKPFKKVEWVDTEDREVKVLIVRRRTNGK